ncbi:efflux RND transporter periplasmic adaptor subunit [Aureimonas populi]|uniref:Efflux RND transporter periplasmic adaptor subunit n=1 Tax=Aureimonas populi TaxID=1701758 RepID=A0ABW5CJJ2_9HYPH|nr:efflux RND transporter periplasmic adaptor subunit [Aureimonas populi]
MLQRTQPSLLATPAERRHKSRRRRYWLAALAALILAGGAGLGLSFLGESQTPSVAYSFATATRGTVEDSIAAVGTLSAVRSVDVGAQVSGQLTRVHVAVGERVEEGQLLAQMDPAIYESTVEATQAQLDNLNAQLINARAQLVLAEIVLDRQQNLSRTNTGTRSDLDNAVAALAAAQAGVDGLEAQVRERQSDLRRAEANLGYTQIYSPLSGTVVSQSAEQGQTLAASQTAPTIVTIADLSTMTVEADVSEADVSHLRPGMEAYFTTLGDPSTRWTGALRLIKPTPTTENNVVLYQALFDVPNESGALMIDMTAQVFFLAATAQDVVSVPTAAIQSGRDGETSVLVRTGSGVERRAVEVGLRTRALAEIRSGLEEGEEVVVGQASASSSAASTRGSQGGAGGFGPPPF